MPRVCIARGHTPRKMHLKGEEEWVSGSIEQVGRDEDGDIKASPG